jgi:hypothetical protein
LSERTRHVQARCGCLARYCHRSCSRVRSA